MLGIDFLFFYLFCFVFFNISSYKFLMLAQKLWPCVTQPWSHLDICRLLTALAVPSVSVSLWCRSSQTVCKEKHNNSKQQQRVSQSATTTATTPTAGRSRHTGGRWWTSMRGRDSATIARQLRRGDIFGGLTEEGGACQKDSLEWNREAINSSRGGREANSLLPILVKKNGRYCFFFVVHSLQRRAAKPVFVMRCQFWHTSSISHKGKNKVAPLLSRKHGGCRRQWQPPPSRYDQNSWGEDGSKARQSPADFLKFLGNEHVSVTDG